MSRMPWDRQIKSSRWIILSRFMPNAFQTLYGRVRRLMLFFAPQITAHTACVVYSLSSIRGPALVNIKACLQNAVLQGSQASPLLALIQAHMWDKGVLLGPTASVYAIQDVWLHQQRHVVESTAHCAFHIGLTAYERVLWKGRALHCGTARDLHVLNEDLGPLLLSLASKSPAMFFICY